MVSNQTVTSNAPSGAGEGGPGAQAPLRNAAARRSCRPTAAILVYHLRLAGPLRAPTGGGSPEPPDGGPTPLETGAAPSDDGPVQLLGSTQE